jgi:tetratricopeptide (TPR) repeat protein
VDDQIGKLWAELVRTGIAGRTVLVITADHGEGLGDLGEQTHGFLLYGSTTHVPLIIRLPDRRYAGRKISTIARLIDVAPTVCDLLGAPPSPSFQGRSLAAEMKGQVRLALPAYSETLYPYRHFHTAPLYALRDNQFTFIEAPRSELYEFRNDPRELHDQAHIGQAISNSLRAELDKLIAPMGDMRQVDAVSPKVLEQLKSLGYVGSATPSSRQPKYQSSLLDPKDRVALYGDFQRALELETHGDVRPAALALERIALRDPALVIAQIEAGLARQKLHEDEVAAEHFGAAIHADPDNALAHFDLGVSLGNLRQLSAAERELELSTKLQPSNSRAFTVLGITRAQRGELGPAIEAFDRALAVDPLDFDALLNRGNVHLMAKEWDMGAADLERAVVLEPGNATIHQALGTMYFYRGDSRAALEQYRKALVLAPSSSTVHSNLGLLYHKTGHNSEASAEFRRALTFDPNNQEAAEGLREIATAPK